MKAVWSQNYSIHEIKKTSPSFYFKADSVKVGEIESILREKIPGLWIYSIRQYQGVNHPKEGKLIEVNIVPEGIINEYNFNWCKHWVVIMDAIEIRKAYYSYKTKKLKIIPKSQMGG